MLKLKYLFDNRDLTDMLMRYWEYDEEPSREVMKHFRISANAVYPFYNQEQLQFLRFAPEEEKGTNFVRAELDFLNYLKEAGYPAVQTVPALSGADLVTAATPWGSYTAAVFLGMDAEPMTGMPYSDKLYYGMGEALAKLHQAGAAYNPGKPKRPDWEAHLDWCRDVLETYHAPKWAVLELVVLRRFFSAQEKTAENYGLIHYDFELDNVFYDAEHEMYYPIDFDDSLYHWFMMDIIKTIGSIQEEMPEDFKERAAQIMLTGYQSIRGIDENLLTQGEMFIRYANIFTYTRIWRSIYEKWDHEPEWMSGLRRTLEEHLKALEMSILGK